MTKKEMVEQLSKNIKDIGLNKKYLSKLIDVVYGLNDPKQKTKKKLKKVIKKVMRS